MNYHHIGKRRYVMNEFIHLNKEQTDSLEWTDKNDPNDVIIINGKGTIIERRPVMALLPQSDGTYISKYVCYELDSLGQWNCKEIYR